MRQFIGFSLVVVGAVTLADSCWGQVEISLSDLASRPGDTYRMVSNAGTVSVSSLVGEAGGPQHWDLSGAPPDREHSYRIVAIAETDFQPAFPQASYAIEENRSHDGSQALSFYRNLSGQGRQYFGFYDGGVSIASQQVVFDAPTIDLPTPLRFGDGWNRLVEYPSDLSGGGLDFPVSVSILFDSIAAVDAYGTMALPGIGTVDVLRVNESNRYETIANLFGMPTALDAQFFQSYSWYAPEIGLVAQIVSGAETRAPADPLDRAAHIFRLVASSRFESVTPELEPPDTDPVPATTDNVTGLQVSLSGALTVLEWEVHPNAEKYRVLAADSLRSGAWDVIATVSGEIYVDPSAIRPQRFYQVQAVRE